MIYAIFIITIIILLIYCVTIHSKLSSKESIINKLNNDINTYKEKLTVLNNNINDKEHKITELRTHIKNNESEIHELHLDNKFLLTSHNTIERIKNNYESELFSVSGEEIINKLVNNVITTRTFDDLKDKIYKICLGFDFLMASQSNLRAIPYMSAIMADYETFGLEILAQKLDWGKSAEREKKVKAIREIRKDAKEIVYKYKEAEYQLMYLFKLFPNLEELVDYEFSQLPALDIKDIENYDATHDYLSKEEYQQLSVIERNQLALDRYFNSRSKSKWQVGRDYELYVGYTYQQKGYDIEYFGSEKRLEDLGRDLIAKKGGKTLIIQCKYWGKTKLIHEKHIMQLYGTLKSYCIENDINPDTVEGILITNITLSDTAKTIAKRLKINYIENYEKGTYPCIKCNIGKDEWGISTRIYHLPFDQQYDATVISKKGEFYAKTVAEAEAAGFRRAFKWFGA